MSIHDYLMAFISSCSKNQALPSENQVAKLYNVSRHAVRKEYELLERMGLIYSKQGVGHFALGQRQSIGLRLQTNEGFSEKMQAQGIPYTVQELETKVIDTSELVSLFGPMAKELGDQTLQVVRLRILYGEPAAMHYAYMSIDRFPKIIEEIQSYRSIFTYYRAKGLTDIVTGKSTLTVVFPSSSERNLLACGDLVPLLELKGHVTSQSDSAILQLTRTVYRSDTFTYSIDNVNF